MYIPILVILHILTHTNFQKTLFNHPTIQFIANQMYNTNFGINFVLYCVSGQNFRRALVEFWNNRRNPNKRLRDTQVTTGGNYSRQETTN